MRLPTPSTQKALSEALKNKSLNDFRTQHDLSISTAVLSRIRRGIGPVSLAAENEVVAALGLPPLPQELAPAPVCPHCGIVHVVGDCNGRGGKPVMKKQGRHGKELTRAIRDFHNSNPWPEGWKPKHHLPPGYKARYRKRYNSDVPSVLDWKERENEKIF